MNIKSKNKDIEIQLKLFEQISKNKDHSQRSLSKNMNIALGLANSTLKKFLKKGLLKLSQAPFRRYSYYITPKGFIEKTKLVSDFIVSSLGFYRKAKTEYEKLLLNINKKKIIIFVGISDLTDIAVLVSKIHNIKISFIYAVNYSQKSYCGIKVKRNLNDFKNYKKNGIFILTTSKNISVKYNQLNKQGYIINKPDFLFLD
tara:strand:- start:865 stop:1467 length:603 start_codon:yes stop_codon:yes gene_type:complete